LVITLRLSTEKVAGSNPGAGEGKVSEEIAFSEAAYRPGLNLRLRLVLTETYAFLISGSFDDDM
jgi:hypothetical protein